MLAAISEVDTASFKELTLEGVYETDIGRYIDRQILNICWQVDFTRYVGR